MQHVINVCNATCNIALHLLLPQYPLCTALGLLCCRLARIACRGSVGLPYRPQTFVILVTLSKLARNMTAQPFTAEGLVQSRDAATHHRQDEIGVSVKPVLCLLPVCCTTSSLISSIISSFIFCLNCKSVCSILESAAWQINNRCQQNKSTAAPQAKAAAAERHQGQTHEVFKTV